MNWTTGDFIAAAVLLSGLATGIFLAFRMGSNIWFKAAGALTVLTLFVLIWAVGAVGIIGGSENDANMLFAALPVVALCGGFLSRFRARGLAVTLSLMSFVQLGIGGVALVSNWGSAAELWPYDVLVASLAFTSIWFLCGWMFSRSAR